MVLGRVLKGKTLGVLGLGRVGSEVARIAIAIGMKVMRLGSYANTRAGGKGSSQLHGLRRGFTKRRCGFGSSKLSDQSKGLLNEPRLRLMKKSAYFINTARRAIVDESALIKALKKKR